jgi:predicted ATPase
VLLLAQYQNSGLNPVTDYLERHLQFQREHSADDKLTKIETMLAELGFLPQLHELVPLFAALLSLPLNDRYPPLALTPERQKQKTLEALLDWLRKRSEKQPMLLILEDLRWMDPSTQELLGLLIEQGQTERFFVLLTFRPEFIPPWSGTHLTHVALARLTKQQVAVMVELKSGATALPTEVAEQVAAKTDGVPLFVEECTKMLLESGLLREVNGQYVLTGTLPRDAIPSTLHDLLMARLDRLGTAKEVAQFGATIGREFTHELLQAVSPLDAETLERAVGKLVEAELLFKKGRPPHVSYLFKHALIQDVAYQSLLRSKRQQYHQQIARVLAEQFPETAETQPELLAQHYTEAGLIGQAIPYYQRAGQRAVERSANMEAISHLTKGLELLKTLPDTLERAQQELTLQIALGAPLIATKGYTAPEVEQTYTRARELCQQVGETPDLFPALWGLWLFYNVRGDYQTACALGEQLLALAQQVQDPAHLLQAHHALWSTLFNLGELASARAHIEQGMALYDPQQHRSHAFLYGRHDPGVCCLSHAAFALWYLGYPDQALKRSHESLTLAQELSHPFTLTHALSHTAVLHCCRRERQATQERAEALIALSGEQGFPFDMASGTILWGWALTEQEQGREGIAQLRQGLAALQAKRSELRRPYFLALLAEAYGKVGRTEEGLTVLTEAMAVMNKTGERYYEAELHRLKGELLSMSNVQCPNVQCQAETCFRQAREVARRQSAKSLELRAAMSLSRLWLRQGKKEEARQLLSETYGWFTEGFDTADLKEAKALLESMG